MPACPLVAASLLSFLSPDLRVLSPPPPPRPFFVLPAASPAWHGRRVRRDRKGVEDGSHPRRPAHGVGTNAELLRQGGGGRKLGAPRKDRVAPGGDRRIFVFAARRFGSCSRDSEDWRLSIFASSFWCHLLLLKSFSRSESAEPNYVVCWGLDPSRLSILMRVAKAFRP